MSRVLDTLGGLSELARLAALSGFRLRGKYWRWRLHAAFGNGTPTRRERWRAVLEYARWVHRMRRDHA
ncbi:MAG: hypothetical protein FJ255_05905 [Phycisphaerae bacterium]|nr:hypothetical protein [Phycisphaerae bacterium]